MLARTIDPASPLHKRLTTKLASRIKMAERANGNRHEQWRRAEEGMMAYLPETEEDRLRSRKRDAGTPGFTTIVVPYTYGMVMTEHTYLTSVFLGRSPIHQFSGRHGESEQQTQALEALIDYQILVGKMLAPYYIWLYDVLKYGQGVMCEYWASEEIQFGAINEILDPVTQRPVKMQSTQTIQGYKGNSGRNVSPWDWFCDPRVTVGNYQQGEFCGERKIIMWNDVVRRVKLGYYNEDVVAKLRTSGKFMTGGSPQHETGSILERPQDWSLDDVLENGEKVSHPAFIRAYEVYVDLIPEEWGLGPEQYPQKWVFTITGECDALLGCQPLGLMHNQFPYLVGECEIEGYGQYNRGMPEVLQGLQNTLDWLFNSHFWNVRQTMNNQFIVDPSRINMKDVSKGGAGWVWRLRPEAYGTKVGDAFAQVPVMDVTGNHLADSANVFSVGERTIGINDQMMGAGPPGGRVTATATRTSAGFGVNRMKTVAEYLSASAFAPHAQRLVSNTQQLYDGLMQLKIAGDLMMEAQQMVQVTPEVIAGQYNFVPVDGTMPIDRFAEATLWKDLLPQMAQVPGVIMQYDLGRIFAWIAQRAGLKNIQRFKIQIGSPAMIAQMVQAGNLIPQGPTPGPGRSGAMADRKSVV